MTIEKNKVVTLTYKLSVGGELLQETSPEDPFAFIYGIGQTLPAFDEHLASKAAGDTFAFTLTPETGYGEYNPKLIQQVDIAAFEGAPEGTLTKGNTVPMQMVDQSNPSQAQTVWGTIAEIEEKVIHMDFNHPLAGKTLDFSGDILEVREATPSELEHGQVQAPGQQ